MAIFHLSGYITEDGKLKVDLPEGLPPGEVEVTIEVPVTQQPLAEETPWTEEELDELLRPNPKSGAEIVALGHTGGWEDMDISDSVEWVKQQRAKRRKKLGW